MMRDIGKNIRDLRQQKHLTQEELAEQLFVTRQTVSNYENGRTRPDVDQILRLAEIFDTDANAVLYGPPVPEGRKTALIQAAAGCGLTAAIYLLYRFFLPTAQDIQSFHYDPRWTAALMYVVRPVFLLLLGWSLVQVLSLAAAVKLPEKPWVRCLRRGLLAIVLCGILSSLFVCIAFFVDVGNVYSVLRPFLYRIIKWNQKPIFHPLLGALLCLLGFPPKRKAPVEKQISLKIISLILLQKSILPGFAFPVICSTMMRQTAVFPRHSEKSPWLLGCSGASLMHSSRSAFTLSASSVSSSTLPNMTAEA